MVSTFETTRRTLSSILSYCRTTSGTRFPLAFLPSAHASLSVMLCRRRSTKAVRLWGRQQEMISKPQHHNDRCVYSVSHHKPPPPSPLHSPKRKIKAFGLFAYHLHTNPNWLFLDARRLGSLFITWDCNLFLLYVEFASDYYVPPLRPGNKRPDDLNCFSSAQEYKCSGRPN